MLRRAALVLLVVAVTVAQLLLGHALVSALGISALGLQAAIWIGWLYWLGFAFPAHRRRHLARGGGRPYARAFYADILPGITCNFAQQSRPVVEPILDGSARVGAWPQVVVALATVAAGMVLIVLGVRTLGVARTLFVDEYTGSPPDVLRAGAYRVLRHPLFVGGVLVSVGAALTLAPSVGTAIAAMNVLVLPAYIRLEDARCLDVFGAGYAAYRAAVPAVLRPIIASAPLVEGPHGDRDAVEDRRPGQLVDDRAVGEVVHARAGPARGDG